jgi:aryl carrier-like protein
MLPSTWVRLPELPVTASGKLDRARLPEPQAADRAALVAGDEPRTPLEERLCELWQDVLHLARVGRDDNFFGIGGNSLQSLQMLNRVRASLGVAVSVRELFDDPTVAGVAEAVERHLADAIAAMSDEQAASLLKELGG